MNDDVICETLTAKERAAILGRELRRYAVKRGGRWDPTELEGRYGTEPYSQVTRPA